MQHMLINDMIYRFISLQNRTYLESDGLEVVLHSVLAVGIATIDDDATQQGDLGNALPESWLLYGTIDLPEEEIADHVVHLVADHGDEGVLIRPVQILALHPGTEVTDDEILLHIGLGGLVGESLELGTGETGDHLLLPLGLDGLVSAKGGTAGTAGLVHSHPLYFPDHTVGGNANMRSVHDDNVPVLGTVRKEGTKARGTDEGNTAQTTEVEHAAAVGLGQTVLQSREEGEVGVVDLVTAKRRGQQGVVRLISARAEGADDAVGHLGIGQRGREVLAAGTFKGRVVRGSRGGLGIDGQRGRETGSYQRGSDGRQGSLDACITSRDGGSAAALGIEARHGTRSRGRARRKGSGSQRQKHQRGELHLIGDVLSWLAEEAIEYGTTLALHVCAVKEKNRGEERRSRRRR